MMKSSEQMNQAGRRCQICNSIKESDYKNSDICGQCFKFLSKNSGHDSIEILTYYFLREQQKQVKRLQIYLLKNGYDFVD